MQQQQQQEVLIGYISYHLNLNTTTEKKKSCCRTRTRRDRCRNYSDKNNSNKNNNIDSGQYPYQGNLNLQQQNLNHDQKDDDDDDNDNQNNNSPTVSSGTKRKRNCQINTTTTTTHITTTTTTSTTSTSNSNSISHKSSSTKRSNDVPYYYTTTNTPKQQIHPHHQEISSYAGWIFQKIVVSGMKDSLLESTKEIKRKKEVDLLDIQQHQQQNVQTTNNNDEPKHSCNDDDDSSSSSYSTTTYYYLNVTNSFLQCVYEAVTQKQLVRITRYQIIPMVVVNSLQRTTTQQQQQQPMIDSFLEVSEMSRIIINHAPKTAVCMDRINRPVDRNHTIDYCSLRQLRNVELYKLCYEKQQSKVQQLQLQQQQFITVEKQQQQHLLLPPLRSNQLLLCNVYGTVSYITPIITTDPKDPFSIMELIDYEKDDDDDDDDNGGGGGGGNINNHKREEEDPSTDTGTVCCHSCIVVFRTHSGLLNVVETIQPGDIIQLTNVTRTKWKIPFLLMKNLNNNNHNNNKNNKSNGGRITIPHRVFIATDVMQQMSWRNSSPGTGNRIISRELSFDTKSEKKIADNNNNDKTTTSNCSVNNDNNNNFLCNNATLRSPPTSNHIRTLFSSIRNHGTRMMTGKILSVHKMKHEDDHHHHDPVSNAKHYNEQIIHYIELLVLSIDEAYSLLEKKKKKNHGNVDYTKGTTMDNQKDNSTTQNHHHHHRTTCFIFLTYFPMSHSLQMSLRPGAIIQLHHIYTIPFLSFSSTMNQQMDMYGASLKSNISIITMSDDHHNNNNKQLQQNRSLSFLHAKHSEQNNSRQHDSSVLSLSVQSFLPYPFLTVQMSCTEYAFRLIIRRLWKECHYFYGGRSKEEDPSIPKILDKMNSEQSPSRMMMTMNTNQVISIDTIQNALIQGLEWLSDGVPPISKKHLTSIMKRETKTRDPYEEIFYDTNIIMNDFCQLFFLETRINRHDPKLLDDEMYHYDETLDQSHSSTEHPIIEKQQYCPIPFSLSYIHKRTMEIISNRINSFLQEHNHTSTHKSMSLPPPLQSGWTGTFILDGNSIVRELHHNSSNHTMMIPYDEIQSQLYVLGITSQWKQVDDHTAMGFIANEKVQVPVHLPAWNSSSHENRHVPDRFDQYSIESTLSWLRVQCLHCTCVYTGICDQKPNELIHDLPVWDDLHDSTLKEESIGKRIGPCAFIVVQGYVFVASFFLESNLSVPCEKSTKTVKKFHKNTRFEDCLSVEDCLTTVNMDQEEDCINHSFFIGLLKRKSFQSFKHRHYIYTGCMMSISHHPSKVSDCTHILPNKVSTIQSLDLKPTIQLHRIHVQAIERIYLSLFGTTPPKDSIPLICSHWKLSNSDQYCAFLSGTWDDCIVSSSNSSSSLAICRGVTVRAPVKAVVRDEKYGYIRLRTKLENMIFSICLFQQQQPQKVNKYNAYEPSALTHNIFDYIGRQQTLPGMVDRRPVRKQLNEPACGELLSSHPGRHSGVRPFHISELFMDMCRDIQCNQSIHLNPSLVRELHHGTFVSLSYCRAMAECTKCFSPLVFVQQRSARNGIARSKGPNRSDSKKVHQETYWHLPLPSRHEQLIDTTEADEESMKKREVEPTFTKLNHTEEDEESKKKTEEEPDTFTKLICPNQHNVKRYAAIKWECSGTIDDGTGQAKLYADRDAALLLLGVSQVVRTLIEEGVWDSDTGSIVYTRAMPPNPRIHEIIARSRWIHKQPCDKNNPPMNGPGQILSNVSARLRAECLMQYYCRSVLQPMADMVYYVQCKPLLFSDKHLNHAKIDLYGHKTQQWNGRYDESAFTYTLPPLNLNLIDCTRSGFNEYK